MRGILMGLVFTIPSLLFTHIGIGATSCEHRIIEPIGIGTKNRPIMFIQTKRCDKISELRTVEL